MKEPVATEMQTQPVTFTPAELLDYLFPEPARNLLHVTVSGPSGARPIEYWLRSRPYGLHEGARWVRADGGFKIEQEPSLDDLLAEHRQWARVAFSPILKTQMDGSLLSPWPCVWAACPVRTFLAGPGEPAGTVDRDDLARALERFATAPEPPHTVIDEGPRVVGLWKLDAPFEDKEDEPSHMTALEVIARQSSPTRARRAVRLLWALAHIFRADVVVASRPEEFSILFPAQKIDDLHPPHVITAVCRDVAARISIELLEQMAEEMSAGLKGA